MNETGRFRSFRPDCTGLFRDRPNRFVIRAGCPEGLIQAHCPNPGKMHELLLPGREVFLERAGDSPVRTQRKTIWTLGAVRYQKNIIPLISTRASSLAGELILPALYHDYRRTPERRLGDSRIDWLLERQNRQIWLEVKACTLVERGRAMFPDAPSIRAIRHLKELQALRGSHRGEVLFVVMNPDAKVFSPNPHTDPAFAMALAGAVERGVSVRAVSVRTDEEGWSIPISMEIPLDLRSAEMAEHDCGALIRIWKHPADEIWHLFSELHEEKLGSAEGKMKRSAGKGSTILAIRGEMRLFDGFHDELISVNGGELRNTDPVTDPLFLDWLLDFRHRRVFSP